jgi:hypothetical protein
MVHQYKIAHGSYQPIIARKANMQPERRHTAAGLITVLTEKKIEIIKHS